MKTHPLPIKSLATAVLLGAMMAASGIAVANTADAKSESAQRPIVKMVQPDGKVIYTDRAVAPRPGTKVQELRGGVGNRVLAVGAGAIAADAPPSTPGATDKAAARAVAPQASAAGSAGGDLVNWAKQQEAAMAAQKRQVQEAQAAISDTNCATARQNLAMLDRGRTGSMNPKTGEISLYTDQQIAAKRAEATAQIGQNCK